MKRAPRRKNSVLFTHTEAEVTSLHDSRKDLPSCSGPATWAIPPADKTPAWHTRRRGVQPGSTAKKTATLARFNAGRRPHKASRPPTRRTLFSFPAALPAPTLRPDDSGPFPAAPRPFPRSLRRAAFSDREGGFHHAALHFLQFQSLFFHGVPAEERPQEPVPAVSAVRGLPFHGGIHGSHTGLSGARRPHFVLHAARHGGGRPVAGRRSAAGKTPDASGLRTAASPENF